MNKRKINIMLLFLFMSATMLKAQTNIEYNLKKYAPSEQTVIDERRWDNDDIENSQVYVVRSMVSLTHFLMERTDSSTFSHWRRKEQNILKVSFDNANHSGDYLHYQGKRQTYGRVTAGGEWHIDNVGTLYGMAAYQNGDLTRTQLNYAIHPEDYAPYFVADTLGPNTMHREIYTVKCGYSFAPSDLQLGIEAGYEGVAQAKKENPRHANYSHLVTIGAGISKVWANDILSLLLKPEWGRQSIAANSLLNGIKFFDLYGFGLWNRHESQGTMSYGRQQSIKGFGTELAWMHNGLWNWTLYSGWKFRAMSSEEYNFKELFTSNTNHFRQQLIVGYRHRMLAWIVQLTAQENFRKGYENVYESQIQNPEEGLTDYVKVGTNQFYTCNRIKMEMCSKLIYHINTTSSVALLGALGWNHNEEKYQSPAMNVTNQSLTTKIGIEYKLRSGAYHWEARLKAGLQRGLNDSYNVRQPMDVIQRTVSYIPYRLRAENHQNVEFRLMAAKMLRENLSAGAFLTASCLNSNVRQQIRFKIGMFFTF